MTGGLEWSTNMSYWSNLVQVQTQASICSMNQYSLRTLCKMVLNLSNRWLQLCLQVNLERRAGGQSFNCQMWVEVQEATGSYFPLSFTLVTLSCPSCSGELFQLWRLCFHLSAFGYVLSPLWRIDFLHFCWFYSPFF